MTTAKPVWRQRAANEEVHQAAIADGYTPLQVRIVSGRFDAIPDGGVRGTIDPIPADLPHPRDLPDIEIAADRIARAVRDREFVVLGVDHDADGQSAGAIFYQGLVMCCGADASRILPLPSIKAKEGYGISERFVDRVLALSPRPTLVLSGDQGSADETRIARLVKDGCIDVVVTDHHLVPKEGPPKSALATVNPARSDSVYPDKAICGGMVAWLVLTQVRARLDHMGLLPVDAMSLSTALDYCALSTVGDCVDMGRSRTNRWAVRRGLALMQRSPRPIWLALAERMPFPWDAQTLSFSLVPRINATGRMGDGARGLAAMCADTVSAARGWVDTLEEDNTERRRVQTEMAKEAIAQVQIHVDGGALGLCHVFDVGHVGVHGVVSGRLVEAFGLPAVCFSPVPDDPTTLSGSVRSIEGVHVLDALAGIDASHPGILKRYGGHKAAGGCSILAAKAPMFAALWDAAIHDVLGGQRPVHAIDHDGPLDAPLTIETLAEIDALQPYGRGFPAPTFCEDVTVVSAKRMGDGTHLSMDVLLSSGSKARGVWFSAQAADAPIAITAGPARILFEVRRNEWKGRVSVELMIRSAHGIAA